MQGIDKRCVLAFRIGDDDVVVRDEKGVCDLALGGKALAGTGCADD